MKKLTYFSTLLTGLMCVANASSFTSSNESETGEIVTNLNADTASNASATSKCPFGHTGKTSEVTECSFKNGYEKTATDWAAILKGAKASLATEGEIFLSDENRSKTEKILTYIRAVVQLSEDNMHDWFNSLVAHISGANDAPTNEAVHDALAAMANCGIGVLYDGEQGWLGTTFICPANGKEIKMSHVFKNTTISDDEKDRGMGAPKKSTVDDQ